MEAAALGLRVDGVKDIDDASKSLDRLTGSSKSAEQAAGGLSNESKKTKRSLAEAARVGESASRSFSLLANAAKIAVAAIGGLTFRRLITESAGFEDAMLGLQAVSGSTADEMARLESQARALGATSMFSAQQSGDAQRFLAQAGFDVNEVLSATPGLLDLAAAGQIDLARAADIASNVLGGMRLEVSELGRVNDVLAATASGANTNIEQLGSALSFAAPFAAAAGVSIEETAAAIGAMSDAGIQASRAGTGLVGIIRQLSKITPAAAKALEAAGIAAEDVNIEARGLGPVLETLSAAGLTVGQAIEIFGSEAGAAALNVIEASDSIEAFTKELDGSEGAAKRMADVIGSGLTGSIRSFQSALSESILQLGESGLTGGFKSVLDSASGVLSVYNDMLPEFIEANNLTEEQASNLELTAAALKAVGAAAVGVASVTAALKAATVAHAAFNAVARANPYVLLATVVAGAGLALASFIDDMNETEERTRALKRETDKLTEGYEDLTKAQVENELQSVSNQLSETRRNTIEARIELQKLQDIIENSGQLTPQGGAMAIATAEDIQRAKELKEEIEDSEISSEALWKAYAKAEERLKSLKETAEGGVGGGDAPEDPTGLGTPDDIRDKMEKRREALIRSLETEKQSILRAFGERDEEIRALEESGFLTDMQVANARAENERQKQEMLTQIAKEGAEDRVQVEGQAAQAQQRLNMSTLSQATSFGSQLAGAIKDSAGEQSNAYKAAFLAQQGFAIASAIINTELAAASALAPPPIGLGPVAGLPYAGVIRGFGYASAALIGAQTIGELASFEGGGFTGSGPRSGGVDGRGGFHAILHPNETVIDNTKNQSMQGGDVNVIINNAPAGTRTEERVDSEGRRFVEVFISDMASGGRMSKSLENTFGVRRQGR